MLVHCRARIVVRRLVRVGKKAARNRQQQGKPAVRNVLGEAELEATRELMAALRRWEAVMTRCQLAATPRTPCTASARGDACRFRHLESSPGGVDRFGLAAEALSSAASSTGGQSMDHPQACRGPPGAG